MTQFGVSRAVFREAVRVVEHTGAARMRRGPGGGLVVTRPNRSAVVTAMHVWFSYVGVTMAEIVEARLALLEGACALAAALPGRERRTTDLLGELQRFRTESNVDPEVLTGVEASIADLAGNPALTLFVEAVADLGMSRLRSGRARVEPPFSRDERGARLDALRAVIEAVRAGDGPAVTERVRSLIDGVPERLTESPRLHHVDGDAPGASPESTGKMAESTAGLLRDHVEALGWPVGDVVGSEADLLERFDTSRAVFREAVRILEHLGAVETKRGPGGGIVVCAPDSGAIVRSARMYLEYDGVTPSNLSEARAVIEVAAARWATERSTPDLARRLLSALKQEARSGDAAVSFGPLHAVIAEGSGNRLLALFVDVMGELVPLHLRPERRDPRGQAELSAEVHRAHEGLVRAILKGDVEQAEKRMKRHMVASAAEFT